jgi:hypothetical protein
MPNTPDTPLKPPPPYWLGPVRPAQVEIAERKKATHQRCKVAAAEALRRLQASQREKLRPRSA